MLLDILCCCFGEGIGCVDLPVPLSPSVVFRIVSVQTRQGLPLLCAKERGMESHIPEGR